MSSDFAPGSGAGVLACGFWRRLAASSGFGTETVPEPAAGDGRATNSIIHAEESAAGRNAEIKWLAVFAAFHLERKDVVASYKGSIHTEEGAVADAVSDGCASAGRHFVQPNLFARHRSISGHIKAGF